MDLRGAADTVDVRDGERLADEEMTVPDRERIPVERAHGRAGDPVALRVVLAAVARATEAGDRDRRDQRHVLEVLRVLVVERAVRLHRTAEVGAMVRDDREARLPTDLAVRAHIGGAARDLALALVDHERRDHELPVRKVRQRADVVVLRALLEERRADHEAERGHGDDAADHAAEPERRELEELGARVALGGRRRRQRRSTLSRRSRRAGRGLGRDLLRVRELGAGGQVAHPQEREDDGEQRPRSP